ncbi:BBE domain-containing protein, partial [Streptomyces cellulosae]
HAYDPDNFFHANQNIPPALRARGTARPAPTHPHGPTAGTPRPLGSLHA